MCSLSILYRNVNTLDISCSLSTQKESLFHSSGDCQLEYPLEITITCGISQSLLFLGHVRQLYFFSERYLTIDSFSQSIFFSALTELSLFFCRRQLILLCFLLEPSETRGKRHSPLLKRFVYVLTFRDVREFMGRQRM